MPNSIPTPEPRETDPSRSLNVSPTKRAGGCCFKLGLWNVRGCGDEWKRKEIVEEVRRRRFHLVTMTETKSETCECATGDDYTWFNSGPATNERKITGVGFLVHKQWVRILKFDAISPRVASIQCMYKGQKLGILGAYAPTECSGTETELDDFYEEVWSSYNSLRRECDEVTVMGDFNCRIGEDAREEYGKEVGPYTGNQNETSPNGYRVIDFCYHNGLRVENSFYRKADSRKYTWYHPGTKRGAILDFVLAKPNRRMQITDVRASRTGNSDHCLLTIVTRMKDRGIGRPARRQIPRKEWRSKPTARAIGKGNKEYIAGTNDGAQTVENLKDLQAVIRDNAQKVKNVTKPSKVWTEAIGKDLRRETRLKRSLWQNWLKDPTDANRSSYRDQRARVQNMVRVAKEDYILKLGETFATHMEANNQQSAYAVLDELLATTSHGGPRRRRDVQSISNEALKEHYAQLFQSNLRVAGTSTPVLSSETELTKDELDKALTKLTNDKAPGRSGIRPELIKYAGQRLKDKLLVIMNSYWMRGVEIPREWIDAEVISIYKRKGSRKDASNYRSIFLLDVIGKVYASMVCGRIIPISDQWMAPTQFGFRSGRSTEQAILSVRNVIQNARDQNAPLVLVFVDLTKAFDTLPKAKILEYLAEMQCSSNAVESIRQLMDNPRGHLRGGDEVFTMERGVRQGSKEGPLLFNIVFDRILKEALNERVKGVEMTDGATVWTLKHIEYADDLCICATDVNEAEVALTSLATQLGNLQMEISYTKTKWMGIHIETDTSLEVRGHRIERVRSFNYLGSEVEDNGDHSKAVSNNIASARRCLIRLRPALRNASISTLTKARLLETFLKPILLYGMSTVVFRARDFDRINACLNTGRRMILGHHSRREARVEWLAEKVPLSNVAGQVQQRRMSLFSNLHATEENIATKVLKSRQVTKKTNRKAYARDWMRQITADAEQLLGEDSSSWLLHPFPVVLDHREATSRPKLVGRRDRQVECDQAGCCWMFATRSEMLRHWRNDHQRESSTTNGFQCPHDSCSKTYRSRGWLTRHIGLCHPQIATSSNAHEGTGTNTQNNSRSPTESPSEPDASRGCPTFRDHKSLTIPGTTTAPVRDRRTSRPPR